MDWSAWREEFPSCGHCVYMNHAGISPLPRRVGTVLHEFADHAEVVDGEIYRAWESGAERVRENVGRLIGAPAAQVAFVRNTSEGLSLVASGLDWHSGDNVVAVAGDYPANIYPWWGLRRFGVQTRLLDRTGPRFTAADLALMVDSRTRVVAVSAVDWQSGFRADLGALAEMCRSHGALLVVDGIQAVGALRLDVAESGIDALAFGGHKWLLAPEGCGALYLSNRSLDRVQPTLLGWKSVSDAGRYLPYHFDVRSDAAKLEPGTPSHIGILALGAAVDLLLQVGIERIEDRLRHLTDALAEGLSRKGAELLSPRGEEERSSILTFRCGDTASLLQRLADAAVVARSRAGGVRLAPHFYNDESDVEQVLGAVGDHVIR
jgi:selenocysteine lyase/cysteine desulfurase